MSELFGNPEQVSELSGNPEQLPHTPTTEEVRSYFKGSSSSRGEQFDRWLAEVKAQVWEEGAVWQRAHGEDRRMKVRFLRELEVSNHYRQGEN